MDKDSITLLEAFSQKREINIPFSGGFDEHVWIQELIDEGFIKVGPKGITTTKDGSFVCMVSVTPKGHNYIKELNSNTNNDSRIKKGISLHTLFDSYTILDQIGQGGNGRVFKVKSSDGEILAAKIVDKKDISGEKIKRFKNEVDFCLKCRHENIIPVLDYGATPNGEYGYYVMPCCETTLRKRIKNSITPEEAIVIFGGLINAIEKAHNSGIIHRDLKPENILMDGDRPFICDFGIAHFPSVLQATTVETQTTDRMGNFNYLAPEQRNGTAEVTERADIYALGMILNEMITGTPPYGAGYKRIGDIYKGYSFLDELVEAMIQQNPEKRIFPASKIRSTLNVLIETAKNESNIEAMKVENSNKEEYIPVPVPEIADFKIKSDKLVFILSDNMTDEWGACLTNGAYDYSATIGYEPNKFRTNGYTIFIDIKEQPSIELINQIISNLKTWLIPATELYNASKKKQFDAEKRYEEERIRSEIENYKLEQKVRKSLL